MSKTQGKNLDLLDNLADTTIAEELDSRLRELEKNIAVAREFIRLADESYSELRHKWNLLHEEAQSRADEQSVRKDDPIEETRIHHKTAKPKRTEHAARVPSEEPGSMATDEPASHYSHKGRKPRKARSEPETTSTETSSVSGQLGLAPTKGQSPKHKKVQRTP